MMSEIKCKIICVHKAYRDWILPRLECLGFGSSSVIAGHWHDQKITGVVKALFIAKVAVPLQPNRGKIRDRVRLALRGDKLSESETEECMLQIMACTTRKCSDPLITVDGIQWAQLTSGPDRRGPIGGHPVFTVDVDVCHRPLKA